VARAVPQNKVSLSLEHCLRHSSGFSRHFHSRGGGEGRLVGKRDERKTGRMGVGGKAASKQIEDGRGIQTDIGQDLQWLHGKQALRQQ